MDGWVRRTGKRLVSLPFLGRDGSGSTHSLNLESDEHSVVQSFWRRDEWELYEQEQERNTRAKKALRPIVLQVP